MTVPEGGTDVTIKSLANGAKEVPMIKDVKLLGHESPLKWTQTDNGLSVILLSDLSDFKSALVFRIDLSPYIAIATSVTAMEVAI